MTKCGITWKDIWNIEYTCTRNKDHHGDHTVTELRPWNTRQKYWWTKHSFNYERYCGKALLGSNYKCERKPGHKNTHKSYVGFGETVTWNKVK